MYYYPTYYRTRIDGESVMMNSSRLSLMTSGPKRSWYWLSAVELVYG